MRPGSPPGSKPAALENARARATDESPRTTKPYDRTGDQIKLDDRRNPMPAMVSPVGLEPTAPRLKVRGAERTDGPIWAFLEPFQALPDRQSPRCDPSFSHYCHRSPPIPTGDGRGTKDRRCTRNDRSLVTSKNGVRRFVSPPAGCTAGRTADISQTLLCRETHRPADDHALLRPVDVASMRPRHFCRGRRSGAGLSLM
jgi:hypothetical protein